MSGEFESDGPEECYPLLANTLIGAQYSWMFDIPGYDAWLSACDMKPPYAYYRKQLLLLQWRWSAERWVLKSPVHLFALDALLASFPDARIVQLHRDPAKVVASLSCSPFETRREPGRERAARDLLSQAGAVEEARAPL